MAILPLGLPEGKIFQIYKIGITIIYTILCFIINQEGKSGTGRNSESYKPKGPILILCVDTNLTQKAVRHVLFTLLTPFTMWEYANKHVFLTPKLPNSCYLPWEFHTLQ